MWRGGSDKLLTDADGHEMKRPFFKRAYDLKWTQCSRSTRKYDALYCIASKEYVNLYFFFFASDNIVRLWLLHFLGTLTLIFFKI